MVQTSCKGNYSLFKNKFWYDTFSSWIKFTKQLKIEKWTDFLNQPLWYNENVKVGGKSVFHKKWFDKGIIFIHDLVDDTGNFLNLHDIQNNLGIETNFLEVNGLLRALNNFKNKFDFAICNHNILRPTVPCSVKIIQYDKKGCQRINKILSNNNCVPVAQAKWQNEFLPHVDFKWNSIYIHPFKITKDSDLQWF